MLRTILFIILGIEVGIILGITSQFWLPKIQNITDESSITLKEEKLTEPKQMSKQAQQRSRYRVHTINKRLEVDDIAITKDSPLVLFHGIDGTTFYLKEPTIIKILKLGSTEGGRSFGYYDVLIIEGKHLGRVGGIAAYDIQ